MLVRMSEEDPDYEGKWPEGDAMSERVLVPREPTPEMIRAGWPTAAPDWVVEALYRAMLEAAPAAPQMTDAEMIRTEAWQSITDELAHAAYLRGIEEGKRQAAAPQQAEPVAWMAFGGALVHAVTRNAMDPIEAERFDVPLYLHPPAAPQQAEPALNERVGLAYKNGYEEALNDCIRNGGEAWARSMFANGGEHIKPQQAEPVAWVRNLTDPQPHCVTGLQYRTAADADAGVQYIPVYLHPPAAEAQLQGGLDNEELLEAWRTKVPGVEPTDSDLRAFALGVEFGTRGKRVYFDERNSARDAWRRRVKQCETLEAEVQRLRDALEQIEREANQPYIQRIAAAALKVGE